MSKTICINNLAHYFNESLDEIPEDLRKVIEQDITLKNWDNLSLAERLIAVQSIEREQEDKFSANLAFAFVGFNGWLEKAIEKAEGNSEIRRLALLDVEKKIGDFKLFKDAEKYMNQKKPSSKQDLSTLFDPVTKEVLEKMFPCGKWDSWVANAKRNGLKEAAKEGHAKFNPYKASIWFLDRGIKGWDMARLNRVLANNLPKRSIDYQDYFND